MSTNELAPSDRAPIDRMTRDACAVASSAAERSGVSIRLLTSIQDMRDCIELFDAIWRPSDGASIMNVEVLQAIASTGGYVAGAFEGTQMLGASAALWGPPRGRILHSHIAGVSESARGRHLGTALKLHQRAWAIGEDAETITWTFDPLVRRNAHFNITKLGGFVRTYYVNHYGSMLDDLNGEDESDRLKLEWDLAGASVAMEASVEGAPANIPAVLWAGPGDRPETSDAAHTTVLVGVPADIEAIRREDPQLASAWRLAVRDVLGALLDSGGLIKSFDRNRGGYVVTRGQQ